MEMEEKHETQFSKVIPKMEKPNERNESDSSLNLFKATQRNFSKLTSRPSLRLFKTLLLNRIFSFSIFDSFQLKRERNNLDT